MKKLTRVYHIYKVYVIDMIMAQANMAMGC
jgi:hypothetical protein